MPLLKPEDMLSVFSKVDREGAKLETSTVAKLYTTERDNEKWGYANFGIAALVRTPEDIHYIRLYDPKNAEILFQQEIYEEFEYVKHKRFFHMFEANDFFVGLSFADDSEADKFHSLVCESLHRRHTAPAPPLPTMFAPKSASVPVKRVEEVKPKEKEKKSGGGIFGFFKGLVGGDSKSPKAEEVSDDETDNIVIGRPTDFKHEAHLGVDLSTITGDWKAIFRQAGIKPSDLKDSQFASFLMGVIDEMQESGGLQMMTAQVAEVPVHTGRAPPPIPTRPQQQLASAPAVKRGGPPPPGPPPDLSAPAPKRGGPAPPPPPMDDDFAPPARKAPVKDVPVEVAAPTDERSSLMDSIRKGATLKPVSQRAGAATNKLPPMSAMGGKTNDIASKLAAAVASRRAAVGPSQDEDDEDNWGD